MSEAVTAPAAPSSSAAAVNAPNSVTNPPPAQTSPAAPKAPESAPAPELFELKVNGKPRKFTKEELISHASLGFSSQERFAEAAKLRREAESVISRIRDPKKVISTLQDPALGLSRDQIREAFEEWYAKEFIEPEQLTPEQKKVRELEAKVQKYAEDEKSREEEKQRAADEAMTTKEREAIQGQILEALQTSDLPKTTFAIRRLAHWMKVNRANGFDAPVSVLVGQVRNEFNQNLREMVQASEGDVLMKLFDGTDIINKVRKYDLEQLRKLRGGGEPPAQDNPPAERTESDKRLTSLDVNERLRAMQRTGRY